MGRDFGKIQVQQRMRRVIREKLDHLRKPRNLVVYIGRVIPGPVMGTLFALAGCGPIVELPGANSPPPVIYTLNPVSSDRLPSTDLNLRVTVEAPNLEAHLQSKRIAYRTGNSFAYLKAAKWSDRPARLLAARMKRAFDDVDGIVGLGETQVDLKSDYDIQSEVSAFNAVETASGSTVVEIGTTVVIVRRQPKDIIARQMFETRKPAASDSADDVTMAFESALHDQLVDVVGWTLTKLR